MKNIIHKYMFFLNAVFFLVFSLFQSPVFGQYSQPNQRYKPQILPYVDSKLGDNSLKLMIARTNYERAKGYMFYDEIASQTGMLFVFDQPHKMSFWMMNTKVPLDLVFFSEDLKVTEWIDNMVPGYGMHPSRLPHYSSKKDAKYALELKAGSIKELDIKIGDKLEIPLILLYCE